MSTDGLNDEIRQLIESGEPVTLSDDVVKAIWVGDYTKPIPVELTPAYHAQPYTPPAERVWVSVGERLENATHEQLMQMARRII